LTHKQESGADTARRQALSPLLNNHDYRPLSSLIRLDIGTRSHAGIAKQINEDHYLTVRLSRHQETLATSLTPADLPRQFDEYGYALVVADGLGHTGSGRVASRVALSAFAHLAVHYGRWNVRIDGQTATEVLERAEWFYHQVDRSVRERGRDNPELEGMATTLTAAYIAGEDLFVAHVGHSRAYLYRDGDLRQLTVDQTIAQRQTKSPGPEPIDESARDLGHILTDTVGGQRGSPAIEIRHVRLVNGDRVLVCTNGLTDFVGDPDIAELLSGRRSAGDDCQLLMERALARGGKDDVTVLLADFQLRR
jgi:PPM family protein phosphatase